MLITLIPSSFLLLHISELAHRLSLNALKKKIYFLIRKNIESRYLSLNFKISIASEHSIVIGESVCC